MMMIMISLSKHEVIDQDDEDDQNFVNDDYIY